MTTKSLCLGLLALVLISVNAAEVEPQPFLAALMRIVDATDNAEAIVGIG